MPRRAVWVALSVLPLLARGAPVAKPGPPKANSGYSQNVKAWHAAPSRSVARDAHGRPLFVLYALNTRESLELGPRDAKGSFSATDLDRLARLLRDTRTGNMHPIEPRIVDTVYQIQAHFDAAEVRVISGYRSPRAGGRSNHGRGRAIDLIVPGQTDEDVAEYARSFGFHGVGTYPNSGFVHVDVRERSYFWVDSSGPGRPKRERSVFPELAQRSDKNAQERGLRPIRAYGVGTTLETLLATTSESGEDEDED